MPPIKRVKTSSGMSAKPMINPMVTRMGEKLITMLSSPSRMLPISTIIISVITTPAMIVVRHGLIPSA